MKICFIGTNYDKFPIINELIETMRESGEDVSLTNWFANQSEDFADDGDAYIYVDIFPLKKNKPHVRVKRGMSEDEIIELINNLCNLIYSPEEKKDDTSEKEKIIVPWAVEDIPKCNENILIETKTIDNLQKHITGFEFTIDDQKVYLSKNDTDYLIKVFETAQQNGYKLEKVIIDESSIE